MNIRLTQALAAFFTLSTATFAYPLQPVGEIPNEAGTGLDAQFWAQPAKSLKSLGRQALDVIREEPTNATFRSSAVQYGGNDLWSLEKWLGDDVGSLSYQNKPDANVMGDCVLRFSGYIAIPEAGEVSFTCSSDDGSMVWIGGELVILNDGYGAAPGDFPEGTATFAEAGLYPIEIAFFNGDWEDGHGNHGESIIRFFVDGEPARKGAFYSKSELEASLGFPANPLTDPVGTAVALSR
ncbi:PA14 domain-containing protein [Pelagicoccus sp. SDUM812005]|uniref:PA14 domain-containing protein n=1 Tax=Pelagicoccus sp. SDUM812005 TaxID=3041257 RepID=UPI00280EC1E3|nr:PA14 domain-containing protein [Pelagicoccus sp. SDUM812005]MDQ8179355.1 PA14 domain-containing protein [Pelagicoccus sp. SDUM812005]